MDAIIKDVYNNLKSIEILSSDVVNNLKLYISKKYPSYSPKKNAEIFADAIYKIIDKEIACFENVYKKPIKKQLLSTTLHKQHFNVMADDIFSACLHLETEDKNFSKNLFDWINAIQNTSISHNQFEDFLNKFSNALDKDFFNLERTLDSIYTPKEIVNKSIHVINSVEVPILETKLPLKSNSNKIKNILQSISLKIFLCACTLIIILIIIICIAENSNLSIDHKSATSSSINSIKSTTTQNLKINKYIALNKLNSEFKYTKFNQKKLKEFLTSRNSLLVNEPYFSTIINMAKRYDIHPLLLIAITGQEQSFVPKSQANAKKIANNPFNVYGSWIKYNTNIQNTTEIAAQTIIVLSNDKPKNSDTIKWINNKYAEDPNWFKGVSSYFKLLKKLTS